MVELTKKKKKQSYPIHIWSAHMVWHSWENLENKEIFEMIYWKFLAHVSFNNQSSNIFQLLPNWDSYVQVSYRKKSYHTVIADHLRVAASWIHHCSMAKSPSHSGLSHQRQKLAENRQTSKYYYDIKKYNSPIAPLCQIAAYILVSQCKYFLSFLPLWWLFHVKSFRVRKIYLCAIANINTHISWPGRHASFGIFLQALDSVDYSPFN